LLYRLAETYLTAAEPVIMSNNATEAVIYINAPRRRAANVGATPTETAANKLAMGVAGTT
jgi:hypothetical protein